MKEALMLACADWRAASRCDPLDARHCIWGGAALATYGDPGALIHGRASRCYLIWLFYPPLCGGYARPRLSQLAMVGAVTPRAVAMALLLKP